MKRIVIIVAAVLALGGGVAVAQDATPDERTDEPPAFVLTSSLLVAQPAHIGFRIVNVSEHDWTRWYGSIACTVLDGDGVDYGYGGSTREIGSLRVNDAVAVGDVATELHVTVSSATTRCSVTVNYFYKIIDGLNVSLGTGTISQEHVVRDISFTAWPAPDAGAHAPTPTPALTPEPDAYSGPPLHELRVQRGAVRRRGPARVVARTERLGNRRSGSHDGELDEGLVASPAPVFVGRALDVDPGVQLVDPKPSGEPGRAGAQPERRAVRPPR